MANVECIERAIRMLLTEREALREQRAAATNSNRTGSSSWAGNSSSLTP